MSADLNYVPDPKFFPEERPVPGYTPPPPNQIQLSSSALSTQSLNASIVPSAQSAFDVPQWVANPSMPASNAERTIQHAHTTLRDMLGDHITPLRLAGHISVLAVAAIVLFISQASLPNWNLSLRSLPMGTASSASTAVSASLSEVAGPSFGLNALKSAAIPFTEIKETLQEPLEAAAPAAATEVLVYNVEKGDTVLAIAERFGLRPETVQWANPKVARNPDRLQIGDELSIPPTDGVLHAVTTGDTLSKIASAYSVNVEDIVAYAPNNLASNEVNLAVGAQVMVPNGTVRTTTQPVVQTYSNTEAVPVASLGSGNFKWPTAGNVSQKPWSGHMAIDVSSWTGASVVAADAGVVRLATGGWNGGYGQHVIIDHGNGFQTVYAHLNAYWVYAGESVDQGTPIGSVGNTGNSTGPHLHFEVRYQGVRRNPLSYLP